MNHLKKSSLIVFLFFGLIACQDLSHQKKKMEERENRIAYNGFIPEEHQEILEKVRDDILLDRLLKDTIRIAEKALVNPERNRFGGIFYDGPHGKEYKKTVKDNCRRLVSFFRRNPRMAVKAAESKRIVDVDEDEMRYLQYLIVKYVEDKKLGPPLLTRMKRLSQGLNYYVYAFQCANYPKFDIFSFTKYYPVYKVKFNFQDGYYCSYEYL